MVVETGPCQVSGSVVKDVSLNSVTCWLNPFEAYLYSLPTTFGPNKFGSFREQLKIHGIFLSIL